MAEGTGSSNNNKVSRDSSSPWPEIETGAVAFLLDARDDFEAGLLRDWVESRRPGGDAQPSAFIRQAPEGPRRQCAGRLAGARRRRLDATVAHRLAADIA